MKKSNNLIAIVLLSISMSLASCASHGGGCGYWSDVYFQSIRFIKNVFHNFCFMFFDNSVVSLISRIFLTKGKEKNWN